MRMKIRLRHIWLLFALAIVAAQTTQAGGDRYPVFVDCPEMVTGSHCDTLFYQVRAEVPGENHPNNANIRYHLASGPGEIDERTGLWRWKWSPEDSLYGTVVEIAASIGNSQQHMTPPDEYCRFRTYVDDNPSVILVDGKPQGSVFFVTAPGVHSFDLTVEDEDACDTHSVEIVSVDPRVWGEFRVLDDQLVFDANAIDDNKKYVVGLETRGVVASYVQYFIFDTRDNPVPIFENCPDDMTVTHCDKVTDRVRAVDPDFSDYTGITLELVSGPGRIMAQRYWHYIPTEIDIGQTYEVEIAARYGDITTTGDENCRFSVSVEENVAGIFSIDFACGDSVVTPAALRSEYRFRAFDDDCRPLTMNISVVSPPFAGDIYLSGGRFPRFGTETHKLRVRPDSLDIGQTFHVLIEGVSSVETYTCELYATVEEPQPYRVRIEILEDVPQGDFTHVDVVLEEASIPIGQFDFMVGYDASALNAMRAVPGTFLQGCGWEYFQYRFGPFPPYYNEAPSGLIHIWAYSYHQFSLASGCYLPDSLPATLFTIEYLVTNDRTFACDTIPIEFYWRDCSDNTIRSALASNRLISRNVYDVDGSLLTAPDSLPSLSGAPNLCITDRNRYITHRLVDFQHGGIHIICADSIDPRVSIGDINLNNVPYEVADAVIFTNYFVYGEMVLTVDPYRQAAASDVNRDGLLLTIEDLQWLIAIVWGTADPNGPPEDSPDPAIFRQEAHGSVEVLTPDTLGAAWLVFDGDVNPTLLAQGMEMRYAYDGSTSRVLIYSLGTNSFPAGPLLSNVTAPLIEVQTCTYNAAKVEAIIDQALGADGADEDNLPGSFALGQNFPNPFNSQTLIQFDLPRASDVTFSVYNILGKIVYQRTQYYPGGRHDLVWNGRSMSGRDAATGIYFYRLKAGTFTSTKKMILLR